VDGLARPLGAPACWRRKPCGVGVVGAAHRDHLLSNPATRLPSWLQYRATQTLPDTRVLKIKISEDHVPPVTSPCAPRVLQVPPRHDFPPGPKAHFYGEAGSPLWP
jgi:hypothetical protein